MTLEKRKEIFGENLQALRKAAGLSRREIAQALKVSVAAVGNYERGVSAPTLDRILKLAEMFSTSIDEMFGMAGNVETYRFNRACTMARLAGYEVYALESGGVGIFADDAEITYTEREENLPLTADEDKAVVSFETMGAFFDFTEFIVEQAIENGATFDEILGDVLGWWHEHGKAEFDKK